MNKKIFTAISLILVMGCNQNPYPENTKFGSKEEVQPKPSPVATTPPVPVDNQIVFGPNYFVRYEGDLEIKEGVLSKIKFSAYMPSNSPDLELTDLPSGAVYNKKDMELTWTPDFNAANSATDVKVDSVLYKIKLRLRDLKTPALYLEQVLTLRALDSERPNQFVYTQSSTFNENTDFSQTINFVGVDFADKDLTPVLVGFPTGTTMNRVADNKVKVDFRAESDFVSKSDTVQGVSGYAKKINATLQILNPRGGVENLPITWIIKDQRTLPEVSSPSQIKGFEEARFSISAFDTNEEARPLITLTSRPNVGQVEVIQANLSSPYSSAVNVRWSQIPTQNFSKDYKFGFLVCGEADSIGVKPCVQRDITVVIENNIHRAPTFKRDAWPFGTVLVLNKNEAKNISILALDGDTLTSLDKVDVMSSSNKIKALWKSGVLSVETSDEGTYQINLKATSIFGVSTIESFVLTVKAPDAVAPVIDRSEWLFGTQTDVTLGQALSVRLPVRDFDMSKLKVDVVSSNPDAVKASWKNAVLEVLGKKEGQYQIDVIAKSISGLETKESFVVRVNP